MPSLIVKEGARAGERVTVDTDVVLGRQQADFVLEDTEVSRRHARLRATGRGIEIDDLGSTNGTFVNGSRIAHSTPLKPGDVVTVGKTTLEVEAEWRAAETEATAVVARGEPLERPAETEQPEGQRATEPLPSRVIRSGVNAARGDKRWVVAGLVVAAVVVAGGAYVLLSGGTSKEDFVEAARDVCSAARERANKVDLALDSAPRRTRADVGKIRRIRDDAVTEIKALDRPEGLRTNLRTFVAAVDATNRQLGRVAAAGTGTRKAVARARDDLRAAAGRERKRATAAGIRQCGGIGLS